MDEVRIETEIRLSSRGATTLDVVYDGRTPPYELFATWAELGWTPPTPAMPPRAAIDWSTPDPASGRRYSLRAFRAVGEAELPPGTPHASQLVAEALAAARRLGYLVEGHEAVPPPPAVVDLTTGPRDNALVRVATSQPAHAAETLAQQAVELGGQVRSEEVVTTQEVVYRGARNTVSSVVVEMVVVIDRSHLDDLMAAASVHGLKAAEVVDVDPTV